MSITGKKWRRMLEAQPLREHQWQKTQVRHTQRATPTATLMHHRGLTKQTDKKQHGGWTNKEIKQKVCCSSIKIPPTLLTCRVIYGYKRCRLRLAPAACVETCKVENLAGHTHLYKWGSTNCKRCVTPAGNNQSVWLGLLTS